MAPISHPWIELVNQRKGIRVILIDHIEALESEESSPSTMGNHIRIGVHCLLGAAKLVGDQMQTTIHSVDANENVIRSWELL